MIEDKCLKGSICTFTDKNFLLIFRKALKTFALNFKVKGALDTTTRKVLYVSAFRKLILFCINVKAKKGKIMRRMHVEHLKTRN